MSKLVTGTSTKKLSATFQKKEKILSEDFY